MVVALLVTFLPFRQTDIYAGISENAYGYYQEYGNNVCFFPFSETDGMIYYATKANLASSDIRYRTIGWKLSVKDSSGKKLQTMYFKLGGNYMYAVHRVRKGGAEYNLYALTVKGEQFAASVTNDQAGTYYITTVKAAQIYAVKFVPTGETTSTRSITLPEQGVMTFSDVHAWTVPADLKAYIASSQKTQKDGTITLALTEVETIPACTGVILEVMGGQSYELTSTDCGTAMREDGTKSLVDMNYGLRPVISDYTLEKTELDFTGDKSTDSKFFHNYILASKDGKSVFAPTDAGTLSAGKAYYRIRRDQDKLAKAIKENPAAAKTIFFSLGGNGETTGINGIEQEKKMNDGIMFNMVGQKVQKSYKGMVILNGKKFINK